MKAKHMVDELIFSSQDTCCWEISWGFHLTLKEKSLLFGQWCVDRFPLNNVFKWTEAKPLRWFTHHTDIPKSQIAQCTFDFLPLSNLNDLCSHVLSWSYVPVEVSVSLETRILICVETGRKDQRNCCPRSCLGCFHFYLNRQSVSL